MRSIWVLIAVVALSVVSLAQGVMPGTFTNSPVQTVPYAPVLSPPIATLGNGLTPTVVTNRPILVYANPQNVPVEPMIFSAAPPESETETNAPAPQTATARPKYFDFVVLPASMTDLTTDDSTSLGDVARRSRKNVAPIAGRKITNEDIQQMNQKYPTAPPPPAPPQTARPNPGNASAQN